MQIFYIPKVYSELEKKLIKPEDVFEHVPQLGWCLQNLMRNGKMFLQLKIPALTLSLSLLIETFIQLFLTGLHVTFR